MWMKPSSAPDDFHEGNASARQNKTPIGRQKKRPIAIMPDSTDRGPTTDTCRSHSSKDLPICAPTLVPPGRKGCLLQTVSLLRAC